MKRKAQGALEYLFMIAAALIIVFVVIRYLSGAGQTAGGAVNQTVQNLTQELNETVNETVGG